MKRIITSESVTEGHPDKICDKVSDKILDTALEQDKDSKMAVECTIKDDIIFIYGEATTKAKLDYEKIARDFDLLYIFPLANESLHNYSINTMLALNPSIIDYYKPIEFDLSKKTITNIEDKKHIKQASNEFIKLTEYIKLIFEEYEKRLSGDK